MHNIDNDLLQSKSFDATSYVMTIAMSALSVAISCSQHVYDLGLDKGPRSNLNIHIENPDVALFDGNSNADPMCYHLDI